MINATNDSKPRELVPAGSHIARCFSMIHVGTCKESYMGKEKMLNKVRITWELPEEKRVFEEGKEEKPMVISKEYTLSMYEKANLRKELEGWRGQGFTEDEAKSFDISVLLGKPCLLSVVHKKTEAGKEYATIGSISKMGKSMTCPPQINQNFEFNFTDRFNLEVLDSLPDFIKDKIKASDEYKAINNPQEQDLTHDSEYSEPDIASDLPF